MRINSTNKNIAFKGRITPDYVKAVNILREFKNQGIYSPTFEMYRHIRPKALRKRLAAEKAKGNYYSDEFSNPDCEAKLRAMHYSRNPLVTNNRFYSKFLNKINIQSKYIEALRSFFKKDFFEISKRKNHEPNKENAMKALNEIISAYKIANCREQSFLISEQLKKANIPNIIAIRNMFDHCFIICNLAKDAKISQPSTWGKKAFIVDPWMNRVFGSKEEAFTEYKRIFTNGFEYLRKVKIRHNDMPFGQYAEGGGIERYLEKGMPYGN